MSTYTVVLCALPRRRRVRRWLHEHQVRRDDWLELPVGPHRLFLVARDVRKHSNNSRLRIGTVIDVPARVISFGNAGGVENVDRAVGEFLDVTWGSRGVILRRDLFGTVPMVHTSGPGVVAVGDSLLVLRDLRRHLGMRSSTNIEAATARTRTLAMFLQQLSPETVLNEISFVPAGFGIRLPVRTPHLRVELEGASLPERVDAVSGDRVALTRAAAADIAGLVGAVAQIPGVVPSLMLSGGVDSRVLLAAARTAGVLDAYDVRSWNRSAANVDDYACAVDLGRRIGFPLNESRRFDAGEPQTLATSGMGVFATSHLAVYDRVMPRTGTLHQPRSVLLGGQGAGILKGAYGYRNQSEIDRWLAGTRDPSPHAEVRRVACVAQVVKGIRSIGADPDAADASEWHYAAYRAGLHGGAHVPLSLTGMRPLQLLELLAMGHSSDEETPAVIRTFDQSKRGMLDLMMLMDPELAAYPFVGSQGLDAATVAARLRVLGGALGSEEIPTFQIKGLQEATGGGPNSLGESVARAWGMDDITADDLVARTQTWVDAIKDPVVREGYDRLGRLTTNEIAKRSDGDLGNAGPGPAKRLSAVLLTDG